MKPGKIRKFKIPNEISKEDMQNLYRAMFKDPEMIISDEYYQRFADSGSDGKVLILKPYVDEWLDNCKGDEKKTFELYDLVKFLYTLNRDTKVIAANESPDFVITLDGENIGIEHTTLYTKDVAPLNVMKGILDNAKDRILKNHPEATGLLNIFILVENVKVNNIENDTVAVTNYLETLLFGGNNPKPDFIDEVIITTHKILELCLCEDYTRGDIDIDKFTKQVKKKESKVVDYKKNSGCNKVWLLIVYGGASGMSDFDITFEDLPTFENTPFDKIIIFNSFKRTMIEQKAKFE